jgi:hypothetical protein
VSKIALIYQAVKLLGTLSKVNPLKKFQIIVPEKIFKAAALLVDV